MAKRNDFTDSPVWRKASSPDPEGLIGLCLKKNHNAPMFKKNLNASKPSEHPPQVEECLKV